MKTPIIKMADGNTYKVPMFDPIVANHFNNSASLVDTLLHQINEEQIYEQLFSGAKADTASPARTTLLDIGANIGLVSIYAAQSCKRIVALEPARETFDVLKAMTHGFSNIEPVRMALAPVNGECDFYENDLNSTASSTVNTYGKQTKVMGATLGSILLVHQLEHVDVCKIDAEGAEGEALSFEQLEKAKPVIQSYWIETHNCPQSTWETKLGRLVQILSTLGYHKIDIRGMAIWARLP